MAQWGVPENGTKCCYATMVMRTGLECQVVLQHATPEDANQWLLLASNSGVKTVHVLVESINLLASTHFDTDSKREVHDMQRLRTGLSVLLTEVECFTAPVFA